MKAVAYIRLSQDDSTNPSNSPLNQEKIIKDYAERQGDVIIKVYSDINRSGGDIERPAFKEMLLDAKDKTFEVIFVKDWSRLTRDIADLRNIREMIEEILKIKIVSCDGVEDDKAVDVTTLANDWFLKECRKKTAQIHDLKLKEQVPLNRPPYGFRMSQKLKKFVIDSEKVEDVKKIFERKAEGAKNIELKEEFGLSLPTIANILKNKTYLGYNKYKGEWIKGKHDPIISEELFNRCQTMGSKKL